MRSYRREQWSLYTSILTEHLPKLRTNRGRSCAFHTKTRRISSGCSTLRTILSSSWQHLLTSVLFRLLSAQKVIFQTARCRQKVLPQGSSSICKNLYYTYILHTSAPTVNRRRIWYAGHILMLSVQRRVFSYKKQALMLL